METLIGQALPIEYVEDVFLILSLICLMTVMVLQTRQYLKSKKRGPLYAAILCFLSLLQTILFPFRFYHGDTVAIRVLTDALNFFIQFGYTVLQVWTLSKFSSMLYKGMILKNVLFTCTFVLGALFGPAQFLRDFAVDATVPGFWKTMIDYYNVWVVWALGLDYVVSILLLRILYKIGASNSPSESTRTDKNSKDMIKRWLSIGLVGVMIIDVILITLVTFLPAIDSISSEAQYRQFVAIAGLILNFTYLPLMAGVSIKAKSLQQPRGQQDSTRVDKMDYVSDMDISFD